METVMRMIPASLRTAALQICKVEKWVSVDNIINANTAINVQICAPSLLSVGGSKERQNDYFE
jgi:hypothetical protein